MPKRPIINPDPITLHDVWGPLVRSRQVQMAILEESLTPDRCPAPPASDLLSGWKDRYQGADSESDDCLRFSIGLIYSPEVCPACRAEAAMFLAEDWDIVATFSDLTDAALEDLEGRIAWIEHTFLSAEHVCAWPPYRPGLKVRSPIRWAGGKSRAAGRIIAMLPSHDRYIEVFAGGASVFFAKSPAPNETLNDLDPDVINFFRVVQSMPWDLAAAFAWTLVSRQEFQDLADIDPNTISDPVERARRWYYLLMAGFGGEMKFPRFSFSMNDGGGGNRLVGALASLPRRLFYASERLRHSNAQLTSLDWRDCLDLNEAPGSLFYLDPPYISNKVNYIFNMASLEAHTQLAERLRSCESPWVLSLNDCPAARDLYRGFNIHSLEWSSGMPSAHSCTGPRYRNLELLITNF